jgi:uncharacterized membrane protein
MCKYLRIRTILWLLLLLATLLLGGCSNGIGVGLSVGIPIGDHAYVNVGSGRWF